MQSRPKGKLWGKQIISSSGARPSRTYERGRVCEQRGCETKLSMYNQREFCHSHSPVKFPRNRGLAEPEIEMEETIAYMSGP